jgi:alginate O-acetyltransferase complex protein AlgI
VTFVSLDYLFLFLPIVVALYYFFRGSVFANIVILGASYLFYGLSAWWYLIPLMFTSLLDFGVGLGLSRAQSAAYRKALLIISLSLNLGLLGVFKYAPWLVSNINIMLVSLGSSILLPAVVVTLPPGISFYTFQTMSYTIEVYQNQLKPTRDLLSYMAFVTFWPHLVAGPIMRARNLLHQLQQVRAVITADEARYALLLISWGLFKKMVLADNFGLIVDQINTHIKLGILWPGAGLLFAYAFAGQIYCDFSAYTDIARGSAKLVGIELIRNFNTPYFAISPGDFWHRWHISLSTWLRDYLYIPLGGNRFGWRLEYRNLMITMVLGGLWHGAGILFIVWGVWHGFLLVLYRIAPLDRYLARALGQAGKLLSVFITFHLVCFGWVMFRAQPDTIIPILRTFGALFGSGNLGTFYAFAIGVFSLGLITLATDYLGYRKGGEFTDLFKTMNPYVAAIFGACLYFGIVLLAKRESAQFIYFQF